MAAPFVQVRSTTLESAASKSASANSGSRAHSITSSPSARYLGRAVTRAALLAAILLHIALRPQPVDKGQARLRNWKGVAWGSVPAAEPLPCVLAPADRPLRCLRR